MLPAMATRTAPEHQDALLPLREAARRAGVSRDVLYHWVRRGRLPARRDPGGRWLVRPADVERAQASARIGAALPAWRRDRRAAGLRLRWRREAAGLSQLDLARISGLAHETISRLERGRHAPEAETLRRLARALSAEPGELAAGDAALGGPLTAAEAAAQLGVGVGRVRGWIAAGALPAAKVSGQWRIPAAAVLALAASGRLRGPSRRLDPR